ncbi:MAG: hypothetical protein M3552_07595 [Planctomycetota bacterium]|nr:hypothetical protein [Planctomycetota bacterium]
MPEHLTEHVSDWRDAVVVERENRTIRNVALAGAASKNGYRYSESALKAATPLYENVPVFLDHPSSPHRPRDRSARDLAGSVSKARYEAGRLRGDLHTLDTEAGRTLLALAEADGPGVGMSHVVLAERSSDGAIVERIVEVVSVDAVAFPATTSTFRESVADEALASRTALPPDPRGEAVERVRRLMRHATERSAGDVAPKVTLETAAESASTSTVEQSTPAVGISRPGSLESLLAAIDAKLPGHLRRLAATNARPRRRGARAGVYPKHVVVESRSAEGLPEHFAIAWRLADGDVAFGDELIDLNDLAESLGSWNESRPFQRETHDARHEIELLTERLRQASAERDQLAERLTATPVTSVLRRRVTSDRVPDDVFIRTVRRR